MKYILTLFITLSITTSCTKEPTAPPDACTNQSMDFDLCLECCQDKGYSGASLPIGGTCECLN